MYNKFFVYETINEKNCIFTSSDAYLDSKKLNCFLHLTIKRPKMTSEAVKPYSFSVIPINGVKNFVSVGESGSFERIELSSITYFNGNTLPYYETHETATSIQGEKELVLKKSPNTPIDPKNLDALGQVVRSHSEGKDSFEFTDLESLLSKTELVDFILENHISFTCKDSQISKSISCMLLYISNKDVYKKRGNPEINKFSVQSVNRFTQTIGPIMDEFHLDGHKTLASKMEILNKKGFTSFRRKEWNISSVRRTWKRWEKLKTEDENKITSIIKSPNP